MVGRRSKPAKGFAWKLPVVKTEDLGKLGPGLSFGAGCGVGVGAGFPGLRFGIGVGAGCGIGLGFGYGMGKGVAFDDDNGKHTNVGKLFQGNSPSQ
ncbi:hypothetical protein B296_00028440 [Ensete ventricosum]|uniref:Glycine-rich protein n=1 Tax=Ensete ventricosum TaxID=4639 RepID=A0A426YY02_ENSVE|nr:hypothetical protein B296_00028440 [Ensete ventricosum]